MEHFEVEKLEDLVQKLRALTFEELLDHESQLRLKGHTYLTRIDNEVLVEDFQPHKRPYIIGRTQSEGEYLLSSKMPFLNGKNQIHKAEFPPLLSENLTEASFRVLVRKFLTSYEILPQDQSGCEAILNEIVEVYKPENSNFVPSFARWFGDLLIGGGIKLYGNQLTLY